MTDSASRVRLKDGREFGPAEDALLLQWAREGRIPPDALIVLASGEPIPAPCHPALVALYNAPPVIRPSSPAAPDDGGISSLIPYRNPQALTGYYTAVVSLVPGFGVILGPVAIVLGVLGWRTYQRDRKCKGAAHAVVAIVLGLLTTLANWLGAALLIVGMVGGRSHH